MKLAIFSAKNMTMNFSMRRTLGVTNSIFEPRLKGS